MKRVLSIDFDFFVEGCDIQAMDSVTSKSVDWEVREETYKKSGLSIERMFPFSGPSFDELLSHFNLLNTPFLDIWDSHMDILAYLRDKKDLEIVNIDSHHDISYKEKLCDIKLVDCGNWGGYLISRYKVKSWTQIYPAWRKKSPEKTFASHVRNAWAWETSIKQRSLSDIKGFKPDILFICRSSAWVPPVYDSRFVEFCKLVAERGRFQLPKGSESFLRLPRTEDRRLLHSPWFPNSNQTQILKRRQAGGSHFKSQR